MPNTPNTKIRINILTSWQIKEGEGSTFCNIEDQPATYTNVRCQKNISASTLTTQCVQEGMLEYKSHLAIDQQSKQDYNATQNYQNFYLLRNETGISSKDLQQLGNSNGAAKQQQTILHGTVRYPVSHYIQVSYIPSKNNSIKQFWEAKRSAK